MVLVLQINRLICPTSYSCFSFQGVIYDPNGDDYSLKLDGTVISSTSSKIQVTTLKATIITHIVYAALIFDQGIFNKLWNYPHPSWIIYSLKHATMAILQTAMVTVPYVSLKQTTFVLENLQYTYLTPTTNSPCIFDLQPTDLTHFMNIPAKSTSFLVNPHNNMPALLYDASTYSCPQIDKPQWLVNRNGQEGS